MAESSDTSMLGACSIDWGASEVRRGTLAVLLTPTQGRMLRLLVQADGQAVSQEDFLAELSRGRPFARKTLSRAASALQEKLAGITPDHGIEAAPGGAYRLTKAFTSVDKPPSSAPRAGDPLGMLGEQSYRLLVDSIEDYAIYMLDTSGRVLTWNRGAEQNKGFGSAEVLGRHFSLFFVPNDVKAGAPERELAIAKNEGRHNCEGWRNRKSGEPFWAACTLTALRDAHGKLLGFAKVVKDMSERKKQEDALRTMEATLRRERDRLMAAAESSMDAFYICEAVRDSSGAIVDFIFTYLNSNVEKMISIPRGALLGSRMCEILPVNAEMGYFEAYKRVALTGEPFVAEFPIDAQQVTSEWVRVQVVRLEEGIAITAADITERKHAEARILHLAQHDALTGLANRSLLTDRIERAIESAKRSGGQTAVCVLDLDEFKPINDRFGHLVGDEVLKTFASRLKQNVRAADSVIRMGGDEFALILAGDDAHINIENLLMRLDTKLQKPMEIGGHSLQVAYSVGTAYYPGPDTVADELLARADRNMYAAKHRSRSGARVRTAGRREGM